MAKIGVLGQREEILIFRALGLEVFFAETAQEAERAFTRMTVENYGVICLAARWYKVLQPQLAPWMDRPLPAVIMLPDRLGGGAAQSGLDEVVRRAVGTQIT